MHQKLLAELKDQFCVFLGGVRCIIFCLCVYRCICSSMLVSMSFVVWLDGLWPNVCQ